MGFSSEWVSVMRDAAPAAFTPSPDAPNLQGAIIDGQIQLMKGSHVVTMDMFYRLQFANPVNRFFGKGSDSMVVVVAFDDYNHVPASKSMTQVKRKQKVRPEDAMRFTEADALPGDRCPPNWDAAMCNRVFKTKLIKTVMHRLGELVVLKKKQRLIVDFQGCPVEYSCLPGGMRVAGNEACACFARELQGFGPVGEADCKFPRWTSYIAGMHPGQAVDIIVEATDSDYIMIAMMHYELASKGDPSTLGRLSIRRIQGKTEDNKRAMEYVHIPLLTEVMIFQIQRLFEVPEQNTAMSCLLCMVGLGGTDFCRGMPRVGGKRLWGLLQGMAGAGRKLQLFKRGTCEYDEGLVCDHLMTRVYGTVFAAHVGGWDGRTLQSMSSTIKSDRCKLSGKVKEDFPTMEMMATTVRNLTWTLGYWMAAVQDRMQEVPDPLQVRYGYVTDSKGRPQWLDVAMRDAEGKRPRLSEA